MSQFQYFLKGLKKEPGPVLFASLFFFVPLLCFIFGPIVLLITGLLGMIFVISMMFYLVIAMTIRVGRE